MKHAVFILMLAVLSLGLAVPQPTQAQTTSPAGVFELPVCGVSLNGPRAGAVVGYWTTIWYGWGAEPEGTASRSVVLWHFDRPNINANLPATPNQAVSDSLPVLQGGAPTSLMNWAVVFYDAAGAPLCASPIGVFLIVPTPEGGSIVQTDDGATVLDRCGGVVIVVRYVGSPYSGAFDIEFDPNASSTGEYEGTDACEDIHGTDDSDFIYAEGGDDVIYGYGGIDVIDGGPGNDPLFPCFQIGNFLIGGPGDDILNGGKDVDSLFGDDPSDPSATGNDTLNGGEGSDIFEGGPGDDEALDYDPLEDPPCLEVETGC
ncbi:MAG: calcium-binding protein [Anaerolineae bacterium]|nr:calcium-binding protein [Anaerolineae bacterium]